MSKNNNVNPNFYKVGGREHTEGSDKGEFLEDDKQALANNEKQHKEGSRNFIPGRAPVGERERDARSNDKDEDK